MHEESEPLFISDYKHISFENIAKKLDFSISSVQ